MAKRERKYYTWGRTTIPYTLECEQRMPRSEFLEVIGDIDLHGGSYGKVLIAIKVLTIIFIVISAVSFIGSLERLCKVVDTKDVPPEHYAEYESWFEQVITAKRLKCITIILLVSILFILPVFIMSLSVRRSFNTKQKELVSAATAINGCSDKYTSIPNSLMQKTVEGPM